MNRGDNITETPIPIIHINNGFFSIFSSLIGNNLTNTENTENTENTNNGVSEEFKNNLEEHIVDEEFIKNEKQCSICLDTFKLGDKYIILPCSNNDTSDNSDTSDNREDDNHVFHSGDETCSGIKPWLERNNTCPMCRKEFPKSNTPLIPVIPVIPPIPPIPPIQPIQHIPESLIPTTNTTLSFEQISGLQSNNIPNPNELENTLSNLISNYINEIEDSTDEIRIQMAIEASLETSNET